MEERRTGVGSIADPSTGAAPKRLTHCFGGGFALHKTPVKSSKAIVVLLVLNLGVFLGILGYFLRLQLGASLAGGAASSELSAGGPGSGGTATVVERLVTITNELKWAQLESEDYHTYIARLRAIGCPEQTIRDLIIADLDKTLAPELQSLYGRRPELKYWHPEEEELANDTDPRELAKKERAIDQRKRAIIRELVNVDLIRERQRAQGQADFYERRLAFLPEDRRDQVRQLTERFDEAEQKIREKELDEAEPLDAAERAQLRALRQQRESELNALLSPEEKEQYELWLSPTANSVRHALYGMNASEQEFQTIYQARKTFEERWGRRDPDLLDAASRAERQQAQAHMEESIRGRLGEERYAEFKRGEDEDFHRLSAVVTRYKLPREKAAEVYGYKKVAADYRAQVRQNPQLSLQQQEEATRAIREETEAAVKGVLGEKAFRYYLRTGQGQWIRE